MKNAFCVLSLSLFLAGCMTIGKPFPAAEVPSIVVNKTTRSDLVASFGQPYRTGMDDGDETWTYVQYKLRLLGEKDTRDLYVRFNSNGTVKSYSFNSSLEEDRGLVGRKK